MLESNHPISGEKVDVGNTNEKPKNPLTRGYQSLLTGMDSINISPNRLVTLRTGIGVSVAAILAATEGLHPAAELGLMTTGALALIADRTDGDLARYTHQTSIEGENLDALADKVVVYACLLGLIYGNNTFPESANDLLIPITFFAFVFDSISTALRGKQETLNALKASWRKPLTQEEREENKLREKSKSAANIFGKLKTGAAMGAIGVGYNELIPLSPEVQGVTMYTLLGVSTALSGLSLGEKLKSRIAALKNESNNTGQ